MPEMQQIETSVCKNRLFAGLLNLLNFSFKLFSCQSPFNIFHFNIPADYPLPPPQTARQ
jgi:hypothetical protein